MATKTHHRPPPSGPQGRGHVSPLGNLSIDGGGQILKGGGSSGPLIRKPLNEGRKPEKLVVRRFNQVPIAG